MDTNTHRQTNRWLAGMFDNYRLLTHYRERQGLKTQANWSTCAILGLKAYWAYSYSPSTYLVSSSDKLSHFVKQKGPELGIMATTAICISPKSTDIALLH